MNKLIFILALLFPKSISADQKQDEIHATVTIVEEEIEIIYIPPTEDEENPIFTIK
tara:strand:+ start:692 stop:859 length:168 start_codon:yes stop_codon:yes gene_type:complete